MPTCSVIKSIGVVQALVSSWAQGSQQLKFVTKAVYASSTSSYYAVVQQNDISSSGYLSLLSWPSSAPSSSLEQLAKRQTLTGSVHSIHPRPVQATTGALDVDCDDSSSAVAIIYSDGRVGFGAKPNHSLAAGSRVFSTHADGDMLAVICKLKGDDKHQLEIHNLQASSF